MIRNKLFCILYSVLLVSALMAGYFVHRQQLIPYNVRETLNTWVAEVTGAGGASHGPENGGATHSEDDDEKMAQLRALGYLAGSRAARNVPPDDATSTVTYFDSEKAYNGLNFYVSGQSPEGILMGMKGGVLHRWSLNFETAAPDHWVHQDPDLSPPGFWRRAHLFGNGDLLVIYDNFGLFKIDRNSNTLWSRLARYHHDLSLGEDGAIYVLAQEQKVVPEIRPDEAIWEDFVVQLSPDGQEIRKVSLLECVRRSKYAPLLDDLEPTSTGGLFHTNTLELVDESLAGGFPNIKKGDVLVSFCYLDTIAVVDLENEVVVWAMSDMWRRQHQPTVLDSGNMLIFDNNRYDDNRSKVFEFNPVSQDIVWSYGAEETETFYSATLGSCQRLRNGNTLITDSENGRAFEVTHDREVVWEFVSPHRVGEERSLTAHLFEMIRMDPNFPIDWVFRDEG